MREIAYQQWYLSSDDRMSKASPFPGEGDKTSTYTVANNWIPIYGFNYEMFVPDPNTIQAKAPKPVDQKPMQVRKLIHNATPIFMWAHSSKKGIWSCETHIMKASGQNAEEIAVKITHQNGVITKWRTVTEIVRNIEPGGKYNEWLAQYEEIEAVFTYIKIEHMKLTDTDKVTMGDYDFQNPNKGKETGA